MKLFRDPRPSFYDPPEEPEPNECPVCGSDLDYDFATTTLYCHDCLYTEYVPQAEDFV